jgi:hypothetical protein
MEDDGNKQNKYIFIIWTYEKPLNFYVDFNASDYPMK